MYGEGEARSATRLIYEPLHSPGVYVSFYNQRIQLADIILSCEVDEDDHVDQDEVVFVEDDEHGGAYAEARYGGIQDLRRRRDNENESCCVLAVFARAFSWSTNAVLAMLACIVL
ncbi:hypothetical protein SLE2022_087960 [Rubroshorea leprosula]